MKIIFSKVNDCFHCPYKWNCYKRRIEGGNSPCEMESEVIEQLNKYSSWNNKKREKHLIKPDGMLDGI